MARSIIKINISNELDVVLAYKRAMQLSERLGMATANQTKFATAVSEICRNIVEYVGSGTIRFNLEEQPAGNFLEALATDRGRGIGNLDDILANRNIIRSGRGLGIIN
ncbi:MAG: histidine kinase, partial [Pontibacter sp.]|nr:histidine kinase [Pontibacter sp.]